MNASRLVRFLLTVSGLVVFAGEAEAQAPASVDTFGSGGNRFEIQFVSIGNPGNAADAPSDVGVGFGSVGYRYRIGMHEVSRRMVTAYNALSGGPAISLANMSGSGGNGPDRPAAGLSWNEGARFVNWLNTSSGHRPAYKFTTRGGNDNLVLWSPGEPGYDASNRYRNKNAQYFLPNEDEWHKAAFYDPRARSYWLYANGSNGSPVQVAGGTDPNTAVWSQSSPADITNAGGLSPYGTMAQNGNVWEWMESAYFPPNDAPDKWRGFRGGHWGTGQQQLRSTYRTNIEPTDEVGTIGIRVASLLMDQTPTTTGIPPASYAEDAGRQTLNLRPFFDDEEDGSAGLSYAIVAGNPDPAGILLNPQLVNGVLSFEFLANANGNTAYQIRATDRADQSVEAGFSIEVTPVDDPPVAGDLMITGPLLAGTTLVSEFSYADHEQDPPGDHLHQWFSTDPAAGSERVDIPGATNATYLPGAEDVGKLLGFEVTPVSATGEAPVGLPVTSTTVGPIEKAPTTLVITADAPDPSFVGEPVALQFSLAFDTTLITGTPTGTFTVTAPGATPVVVPVTILGAIISLPQAGTQSIAASYSGDGSFQGSADSVSHLVHSQVSISLGALRSAAEDDARTFQALIARTGDTDTSLDVNLAIGGSATVDSDYVLTGSTTIPAGADHISLFFETLVENLEEADETIALTLHPGDRYSLINDQSVATATIINDDFSPVANPEPPYRGVEDDLLVISLDHGLLANDTDQDDGDGPQNLTAIVRQLPAHGTLELRPDGSFTYTPDPDYFGPDSFTYFASDGTNLSESVRVDIEVTQSVDLVVTATSTKEVVGAPGNVRHTLTVQNLGPSDATNLVVNASTVMPGGVLPLFLVFEGNYASNLWAIPVLAEGESATMIIQLGIAGETRGGIDSLSTTATVTSVSEPLANPGNDSASIATSIISPRDVGVSALGDSPALDLQSGLFTQKITITNNNPLPLAGFRLHVANLPDDVALHNGGGIQPEDGLVIQLIDPLGEITLLGGIGGFPDGTPFLISNQDLAPGASVTLTLEFFRSSLDPDSKPAYSIEAVFAEDPPVDFPVAIRTTEIDRLVVLENGDFLVEFTSVPGRLYSIEYTHDMVTWHRASPAITANANRTQWVDSGPPKTRSHPSDVQARTYRIVTLSN